MNASEGAVRFITRAPEGVLRDLLDKYSTPAHSARDEALKGHLIAALKAELARRANLLSESGE